MSAVFWESEAFLLNTFSDLDNNEVKTIDLAFLPPNYLLSEALILNSRCHVRAKEEQNDTGK